MNLAQITPHEYIGTRIKALSRRLWEVSLELHANPELSYHELRASTILSEELASAGFGVDRGGAGLPTSFVARAGSGDSPRVALILEYDALPGLGHACGHNLIAAAGLGAALALRDLLPTPEGTLLVVGSPAEEDGGGKVAQVEAGVFDGVDAALMFHPGVHNWSWAPLTAMVEMRITFHGRAAHPTGNPDDGVDALRSLIQLFNALTELQRITPNGSHVQGIVTEGGKATNILPDLAEGRFCLRAMTTEALDELVRQVTQCAGKAAEATGAEVTIAQEGAAYTHFQSNPALTEAFTRHLARLGIEATEPDPDVFLGSSDIGNVSTRVPTIHPFLRILPPDHSDHTPAFAAAAGDERGRAAMLAAAEALACTAYDVLSDPTARALAWETFQERRNRGLEVAE
ncbi:amidohydrolase [Streptomyces sp. NPDC001922]|uniref:amidohydrolase n=1 Tax=Streptomyces sp. NPDC001922 TaxID=3364624 RepID=UPI0036D0F2C6